MGARLQGAPMSPLLVLTPCGSPPSLSQGGLCEQVINDSMTSLLSLALSLGSPALGEAGCRVLRTLRQPSGEAQVGRN